MSSANDSQLKILVVEDDKDMMFAISRVLSRCNCDVVGAESGQGAFDILSTQLIDVIFSDMRLVGEIDGEEILRKVRKSYPNIKVVMMSAIMNSGRRSELLGKGADECLEKPFFNDTCTKVLCELDDRYQQAA